MDVVPGQIVDVGSVYFSPATGDQACWRMFSPTWSHDGSRILYLFRESTPYALPVNNIRDRVLDMNPYTNAGRLYRIAFAPTAARADEMLFLQNEATFDYIYHAPTANATSRRAIDLGPCPRTVCDIFDIAWLPDGSGFIVARRETGLPSDNAPPVGGALYRYTFANIKLTEIVRLPDEIIGKLAIAPEGASVVFERGSTVVEAVEAATWGPAIKCPCSLWRVNGDGSGLKQLVADGRPHGA